MKDTPAKTDTINPVETEAQAKVKALAARRERGDANASAFAAKVLALAKEGAELDGDTLDGIARLLGKSADSKGYPTESAYYSAALAMAHRKMSYEQRADFARKANAACSDTGKPVAKVTAKANSTTGKQDYKLTAPAQSAANLG